MKIVVYLSCLGFLLCICNAQPSEEQIKKDVGNSGVISYTFPKKTGTRQWNTSLLNWEYVRGVQILRKSNFAGINVLVSGDAVYQDLGGGKYSFLKFRVLSNSYDGLKEPSRDEILQCISQDWLTFYGFSASQIIDLIEEPDLALDPEWNWDSPKTLDLKLRAKVESIYRGNKIAIMEQFFKIRLFRDDMKSPWTRFIVTSRDEQKVLSEREVSFDEIRSLSKKSLEFTMGEKTAKAAQSKLPSVAVPEFKNVDELGSFIHNILRNGNEDQFRAAMLKLLSPRFFEQGSSTQLTAFGEQLVKTTIELAYKGDVRYADEYCQNFEKGSLSSEKYLYIQSCLKNVVSVIGVDRFNMGYVEGKAVSAWKIIQLDISCRKDDDAKNFIRSFSKRSSLCPKD